MSSDANVPATKADTQIILDAMGLMKQEIHNDLVEKLGEKHEETRRHLSILIEDAEIQFFATSQDQTSFHSDKLENHEERIVGLEKVSFS